MRAMLLPRVSAALLGGADELEHVDGCRKGLFARAGGHGANDGSAARDFGPVYANLHGKTEVHCSVELGQHGRADEDALAADVLSSPLYPVAARGGAITDWQPERKALYT